MAQYLIGALCMLVGFSASAEGLKDPTLPPAQLSVAAGALAEEKTEMVLQLVTLGSTAKSAMISGKTVLLGQKYQEFQLVALSPNQAILRTATGKQQVLTMIYPIKKMVSKKMESKLHISSEKPHEMAHEALTLK